MTALAKDLAKLEIDARIEILFHQYSATTVEIAEGLYFVGKTELGAKTPTKLTIKQVVLAASHIVFTEYDSGHWDDLWFMNSSKEEAIELFYANFQELFKYKYDVDIKTKIEETDKLLITWIAKKLEDIIPELTTNLCSDYEEQEKKQKMDAKLAAHYGQKSVDKANEELANRMDTDAGEAAIV